MWVKRIESSELTPDVVAAMKNDGLAVRDSPPGSHVVTITTDNDWLANKWEMSERTATQLAEETFLDQLARMGAARFILLFVLCVLAVAWLLWIDRR